MAAYKVRMVQNDTGPPIDFEIYNEDDTRYNLTGATVRFKIKDLTIGNVTNATGTENQCTLTDAVNGKCRYVFLANHLPSAGSYNCDLEITDSGGKVQTLADLVQIIARAEVA